VELTDALAATPTNERDRIDREAGRLTGSRCRSCATVSWPARAVCHRCGSAGAAPFALADHGDLITYTTVWVPRPGIEAPFTLGQVELRDEALVFAHVRGLEPGDLVRLPVRLVLAEGAEDVPPFWFEPDRR
jgi:uncharacterized OB-fold protein